MSDSWMFILLLLWLVGISMSLSSQSTTTNRIEHKLDLLLRHAAIDVSAAADKEIERLIKAGQKGAAVTYYRELTGAEKKVAKQHVDDLEWQLIQQKLQA